MNKNVRKGIKIFRWIIGVLLLLSSIGGFESGDITIAIIILFIGLIIIPPIGLLIKRIFTGKTKFKIPSFSLFNTEVKDFIKEININDDDLISTIDSKIKNFKKSLNDKKLFKIGLKLYDKALKITLEDLHLSDKEKEKLKSIIEYFKLPSQNVSEIKKSINQRAIESLYRKSYDDKILTDEEQENIVELANYLELPDDEVKKIKSKVSSSILEVVFNEKLNDKKLSPNEETELVKLLGDMKIEKDSMSDIIPQNSLRQLAYAKLLWSLDKGLFYSIPNPPIMLKKNEECYLCYDASLVERKTVNEGYSYGGGGISVPITKGVRLRSSSGKAKPIKEEVTVKHSGKLSLTNLRIVFATSENKSFQIPFTKLLSFNFYDDGIEFIKEKKNYLIKLKPIEAEFFGTGMTSSIRNYLDTDNDTLNKAMKDVENNESFIKL